MPRSSRFLAQIAWLILGGLLLPAAADEIPNFLLLDANGKARELHRADGRAVVLFFTEVGCPVARKNAGKLQALKEKFGQDLTVWMVDSDAQDEREAVRKEAQELGITAIPVLMDSRQALALALDVQRTAEVVALDTKDWTIFYRGAVDDQLSEGAEKPEATKTYLQAALQSHFAGEPVAEPRTSAKGCLFTFEKTSSAPEEPISYSKQIAPILKSKCASCHRDGDIGPFAFSSYKTAKKKAHMIEEVVLTQRMPPWHADPHYGKFTDLPTLSAVETQTLIRWINQGAPQDQGADPLAEASEPAPDWPLGTPDYIIKLPRPEEIPATGVLSYRHIHVDSPVTDDVWLAASVVKPGNRQVLHHCIVYAKFEGSGRDLGGDGVKIAGWAPGRLPARLPEGTGVFLGKNARLDIELHYTTNGSPQTDDTQIGLYLLHQKPPYAFKTGMALRLDFKIPPNTEDSQTSATFRFDHDSVIYTFTPHMHMRGSWMNYEAYYPDGRQETLLSVPRFDFNWQTTYHLAEPLKVPAGTKIVCTGAFDNSTKNPSNPDPTKAVHWGPQSWDEMFIGYVGYSE
ncbi:MAG TPA: redoxin domain-containing protein, partial [Chthoniobacteraceae bacterium]